MSDIAFLPATELLKLYRARELSPVEATEAALLQIELYNPRVNAYCLVDAEQALAQARQSEERYRPGMVRGRAGGGAAAGARRCPSREDDHTRVRMEGRHGQPTHRTHGEPMESYAHGRRIERRKCRGGGAGHGAVERGNRRRR